MMALKGGVYGLVQTFKSIRIDPWYIPFGISSDILFSIVQPIDSKGRHILSGIGPLRTRRNRSYP